MYARSEQGGSATGNRTPLQAFMLGRLSHLLEQRARLVELLPADDWRRKLMARALYSTYQDCVSAGLASEAKDLITSVPTSEKN